MRPARVAHRGGIVGSASFFLPIIGLKINGKRRSENQEIRCDNDATTSPIISSA